MAFSTTSKFVQLAPYLVMEYRYADQPNPESYFVNNGSPAIGFNKLVNGVLEDDNGQPSNDIQIMNLDQDQSTTQNTRNNSVVQTNSNTFITLDPGLIVPYNDFNSELTPTSNLAITFPSNISVIYDSIRYHVLAGYNLDNIDGLVLQVQYLDVNGSYVTFSQIKLSKGSAQTYALNPNPVTIGSNIFDKYYEVKIPSLVDMNNKYGAASGANKSKTLAALTSKSGRGYQTAAPMRIKAYQILSTTKTNGYNTYGVDLLAALSLESTDPFKNIGAYIAPSDQGDYFEYFATDNGGFPEDFILFQNSIGNSYYIQHTIETLEQVGGALLNTSNFTNNQTTAYDVPNLLRPIVRYSSIASSFTLRYTMTLVNNKDQSRLIRIATYTSNDVSRYGAEIQPLQLQVLPQQQKIYNKVTAGPNISMVSNRPKPKEITKFSNVFIDRTLVNTSLTNLKVSGTTLREDTGNQDTASASIAFGVGKAYIEISPFDNYYKFTFFQKAGDGTTKNIDLSSSGEYSMVFVDNQNKKVSAPSIVDNNIAKPAKGELAFKIDETLSTKILQFNNKKFYISNRPVEQTSTRLEEAGVSRLKATSRKLSSRSFSLNDSITDIGAQVKATNATTQGVRTARISSNSSSVLYWGNWIAEGETVAIETNTLIDVQPQEAKSNGLLDLFPRLNPNNRTRNRSSWQRFGSRGGDNDQTGTSGLRRPFRTGGRNLGGSNLSPSQRRGAIASDVQGKISLSWSTSDILAYFLDPSGAGYKLYNGIGKEEFQQAVAGIFSNEQYEVLSGYGNTSSGRTNGGSGSNKGSNSNQTGNDSGNPNKGPQFPPPARPL
jgi:hypothetical protein